MGGTDAIYIWRVVAASGKPGCQAVRFSMPSQVGAASKIDEQMDQAA